MYCIYPFKAICGRLSCQNAVGMFGSISIVHDRAVLWIGFAKNHLIFPYNVLIEGVCAGIVFWLAPIDTQTRRISESERIYFKRVTRIILLIQSAIVIALICFQKNQIVTIILTGHMGVAGSLMIGKRVLRRDERRRL